MHIRKLVMAGPETWILSAAEKFWAVGHPILRSTCLGPSWPWWRRGSFTAVATSSGACILP
jgi:hypothetical protein